MKRRKSNSALIAISSCYILCFVTSTLCHFSPAVCNKNDNFLIYVMVTNYEKAIIFIPNLLHLSLSNAFSPTPTNSYLSFHLQRKAKIYHLASLSPSLPPLPLPFPSLPILHSTAIESKIYHLAFSFLPFHPTTTHKAKLTVSLQLSYSAPPPNKIKRSKPN
jgi:hypothetical protein